MRGHYRITPLVGYSHVGAITKDGTTLPEESFGGASTYSDLFVIQLKYFGKLRGFDVQGKAPGMDVARLPIPRTTNADVARLSDYWNTRLKRATKMVSEDKVEAAGLSTTRVQDTFNRARPAPDMASQLQLATRPTAVYARNNEFWRALWGVSTYIAVALEQPDASTLLWESVQDSAKNLPQTLGHGLGKVAEGIAEGAGRVTAGLGKGFLSGLGAPLILALGGLGLIALSRRSAS